MRSRAGMSTLEEKEYREYIRKRGNTRIIAIAPKVMITHHQEAKARRCGYRVTRRHRSGHGVVGTRGQREGRDDKRGHARCYKEGQEQRDIAATRGAPSTRPAQHLFPSQASSPVLVFSSLLRFKTAARAPGNSPCRSEERKGCGLETHSLPARMLTGRSRTKNQRYHRRMHRSIVRETESTVLPESPRKQAP